ncbi:protein lethal(2)essential for life-like [Danaus plexippus]|uniref:protein lethal(2)essential for life-like n=1 Tax=Danaus plexippus TaxID=13037 RepID=UPI002AB0CCD7|nr:protein lethal(2)essential for life-like [Danaus plexippus]
MDKLVYLLFITGILTGAYCDEECSRKRRNSLLDQDFGMSLTDDDLITTMMAPLMLRNYFRPWRYLEPMARDIGSTIKTDKDKFTINVDVQHFAPDEITVRTAEGYVIVEAKHEEKQDEHGFVSRQFMRRYSLPEGVESEDVLSELSSDGILTISAPRKDVDKKGERIVTITKTGPVRKQAKETKEESCSTDTCEKPKE